jgi:hypothetical protein
MRRNFLCSALFFAVFLAGGSCNLAEGPEYGKGTLTLFLPEAPVRGRSAQNQAALSRSVISDTDRALLTYRFTFTGPGESRTLEAQGGGITLSLGAGRWIVVVAAYSPGNPPVLVGSGSTEIAVIAGQSNSVRIPMKLDPAYEAGLTAIYIHNEEDLRRIGTDFAIDGTIDFYLERDIVLTQPWSPIGDDNAPFKAEFNGQGHSVTVGSFAPAKKVTGAVYQGFFAYTEGGAIKNITVKYELDGVVDIRTGDGFTYADSYTGGLAGRAANTRFENARVTGNFSVMADGTSSLSVGGIVGQGNDIWITDCRVAGNIGGNSANALSIGGVAGMATSYSTPASGLISGTSFTGDISGYTATGNCYEGGIAGSSDLEITACFVEGRVRAEAGAPCVGGIAGEIGSISITNSYALGIIEGVGVYETSAGGIAGFSLPSSIIENCYAVADVSSRSGSFVLSSSEFNSAGGIAGRLHEGTISKCYAVGTVKVDGAVPTYGGGIVGEVRQNSPSGDIPQIRGCMALVSEVDGGQSGTRTVHLIGDGTATWFTSNYVRNDLTPSHYTNSLTPNDSRDGTSRPLVDFKTPSLYTASGVNWDFSADWKFLPGYDYPVLAWQASPPLDPTTLP